MSSSSSTGAKVIGFDPYENDGKMSPYYGQSSNPTPTGLPQRHYSSQPTSHAALDTFAMMQLQANMHAKAQQDLTLDNPVKLVEQAKYYRLPKGYRSQTLCEDRRSADFS